MNESPMHLRRAALLPAMLGALATLAACAPGRPFMNEGQALIAQGRRDEAVPQLEKAAAAEPANTEYRMKLLRERELLTGELLVKADAARAAGRFDDAEGLYQRVQALDPAQPRARAGLGAVEAGRRLQARIERAAGLLGAGKADEAAALVRAVLAEQPGHVRAQALQQRIDTLAGTSGAAGDEPPALRAALRKPVSLDFREAPIKSVFEALSRSTGLNFVFDREVRADIRVTLAIANVSVDDVINVLMVTNQLERKQLNDNTVLVYPNSAAKQKDYAELSVRTFYLANAEAKSVQAMLKTVLKTRDIHADDKLNSLTLRDTPAALRLAEKLISAQDLPEPEVLLEVEVMEVKRSRLSEIGIEPPGKFTVLNLVKSPDTVVSTATGSTTVTNATLTTTQLTLDKLRQLRKGAIGIDNPSANLHAEDGDTNLLANPRIRVKNHEKARVLIGDRVPVITTTATANVGTAESVSYLDVGLKLDVEPTVYLDNEVGVKVALEVSNIVREVRGNSGSLTYQIGTRLATTSLRLRDGETQALAGLISDEDRRSAVGVPGFTSLPVLGRLFSSERNDRSKTEIVLLVTPRVVRNLGDGSGAGGRFEYASGTEASVGAAPLRVRGAGKLALGISDGRPSAAALPSATSEPAEEPAPPADVPAPVPAALPAPVAAPAAPPAPPARLPNAPEWPRP